MRSAYWLLLAMCLSVFSVQAAERKFALLIGNNNYSIGQLDNPVNDAQDLGNALRSVGFDVAIRLNQDGEGMKRAIREFGDKIKGNDGIGFFFFAGHGVQVNGENYLLPIGVPFRHEKDVEDHAVQANMVMRYMEDAKNRVNLVVLDACRNNPFIKTRSLKSRGLAPMDAPSGSLVAFSTAPGTEASDGTGKNGLYTKHLMANIKVPGLTIEQVFKRTRDGVEKESETDLGRKQSPREESSLKGGDLYFVAPIAGDQGKPNAEAVELAYWNSIQSSTNPADFDSYLSQYPKGKFADLARNRLSAAKGGAHLAKADSRTLGEDAPARLGNAQVGKVFSGAGGFTFDESDVGEKVKAAEFLSISCKDVLKNKKIMVAMAGDAGQSAALLQAIQARIAAVGLRTVPGRAGADLLMRGSVETESGVNPVLGIDEVDVQTTFSLASTAGQVLANVSVSSGAYTGRRQKAAVQRLLNEQADEIVGKLFRDYCASR